VVELLLAAGAFLGLGLFASEGASLLRTFRTEREKGRAEEEERLRREQLDRVRTHMRQIEEAGRSGFALDPQVIDDYDRLLLEERVLEADDLGPLDPAQVDRPLPVRRGRRR